MNYFAALVCCTWAGVNRNAHETIVKGMHFRNVRHRVYNLNKDGEPHRAILRDTDGSLSGTGEYTEIVGTSPTRRSDPLCITTPGLGMGAIACKATTHRRVIIGHSILAQGNQVKITRRDLGVSDMWFGTGVCQPPISKWTISLAVGYDYMLEFSFNGDGGVLSADEELEQVVDIFVPTMKESDAPFIFSNAYHKFTEETGYQELDHVHGPDDSCAWWKAAYHGLGHKLVDCGFVGIHVNTCEETFGCCYDKSAPLPSGSGCFVRMNFFDDELSVWPSIRKDKTIQGKKPIAGSNTIDFDASPRNDVSIPETPWLSNAKDGWTVDFWISPKDRAFYMTQDKYSEQESNLLSFHDGANPVLHVVQQKYSKECAQCGNEVVGGEVRVDVLPMLTATAPLIISREGTKCEQDNCKSTVKCNAGELPIGCSNIVTHGDEIDGVKWEGNAPNFECVSQGSYINHATAKVDCVESSTESWRRHIVNSGGAKGGDVLAECPQGSYVLSCTCLSTSQDCPETDFIPESAQVCALNIPKGTAVVYALCGYDSEDHIIRRSLVVSDTTDSDERPTRPFTPFCQGEKCPSQRELITNGWFKDLNHAGQLSAEEEDGDATKGVASQGNIVIGALATCPQGHTGSNNVRCTGITFDKSDLVKVTKYQIESKGDVRAGPGTYIISAWAFVDPDYDGVKQLLHTTFCAGDDCDVALGGFPNKLGKWQQFNITFSTRKNIDRYVMKLGYPLRHTKGTVHMTGVSILYNVPITASFVTQRLPLVDWTHVLVTSTVLNEGDNTRALQAYINGQPVTDSHTGAQRVVYTSATAPAMVTGKLGTVSSIGGQWPLAPFQGSLDNVRLWNKGFTTSGDAIQAWMGDTNIRGMSPVVNYDFQDMSVQTSNFDADTDENACAMEKNMDYYGHNIVAPIPSIASAKDCCDLCSASIACAVWSFNIMTKTCSLKKIGAYQNRRESPTHISGTRRSAGKAISRPCDEIWDCFDCQRATDSREQFQGQECVPVLDHDKACEPKSKVEGLKLVTDFKCLNSKQALDKVTQKPEGTWKLIIRNGKDGFNSNDPQSDNYVNIGILEANRGTDGKFLMRMYSGFETNTWKQSNNPFHYDTTTGYEPVDVRGTFSGLNKNNLWQFVPFALYAGRPWTGDVAPTKGKIRDVSGNSYDAVMRSAANEDQVLVTVGNSVSATTTVPVIANGALSCPLTVDSKNWHPSGSAPTDGARFAVTVEPSTKVVTIKRMDVNSGWPLDLKFYCSVALSDETGLGSDQNSIVGQTSQIYAGLNQMTPVHGSSHFFKTERNASLVPMGDIGAYHQLVYSHNILTEYGPASKCSDAGCPFVPVKEIQTYAQTFYWSDASGWQQKQWHHGVPADGDDIVIPKEWTVILDTRTAQLGTLTVEGTLVLANGGQHTYCRPNPLVERENDDICKSFTSETECLAEIVDENQQVTKTTDTCVWEAENFPPLFLIAEKINIEGGRVFAGNKTHPYKHYVHIHMLGKKGDTKLGKQMINVHGHFDLYGEPRTSWTRLAAHGIVGDKTITVEGDVGWKEGDQIVINPGTTATSSCVDNDPEYFTIEGVEFDVSTGNTVLKLDTQLQQNHVGIITKAKSASEPGRPGKETTVDVRAAVGLLTKNIEISGEDNGEYGVGISVKPLEKDRPNVHQGMRKWYLEGDSGGFNRYGAKCSHEGAEARCENDISITLRYVAITNAGHHMTPLTIRHLLTTEVLEACVYPSRDPSCPIVKTYRVNKVVFVGNTVRNSMGPMFNMGESRRDEVRDNVAIKVHSFNDLLLSAAVTGVLRHNLFIIGTQATYRIPVPPPPTNGVLNLWRAYADIADNYVTNAAGPAYQLGKGIGGNNIAACSEKGFLTRVQGKYSWTSEIAVGNRMGIVTHFRVDQSFRNTVIVGNELGVHFRNTWKPTLLVLDSHPVDGPIDEQEGHNNPALYTTTRSMNGVTFLGHLWDKCAVRCEGDETDSHGNKICDKQCVHADRRGGKIGMSAARGNYDGVFFGRFDGDRSALISTERGCFTPIFSDTRMLDQDTRAAVKVMYTGFGDVDAVHKQATVLATGGTGNHCGKYDCDYWRHCYVKDVDGTLMLQGKDENGRGKPVSILPGYQQWDPSVEQACKAIGQDAGLAQGCPQFVKSSARIQRAISNRDYQGIQRSTSDTRGQSVCKPHTFTDNGLLCSGIDYFDVFIRDGEARGDNAERFIGPVGVTTEGSVDGLWPDDKPDRPYATEILATGFVPNLFRAIVPSGYIHRIDLSSTNPTSTILQAPWLRRGQSTVFRTHYRTSKEVRLRKNGKGVSMELYKDSVYPYAKHGTWYFDQISQLFWVTISDLEPLEMFMLEVVKISMTAVVTVEQFQSVKGQEFMQNLAQVLKINPSRIKVTNIVPGSGRRRLNADGNEVVDPTSKFDLILIEDDVCEGVDCGIHGGTCVKTATGPKCECGNTGYTGPRCMDPVIVERQEAPIVIVNETLEALNLQQQIENAQSNSDFEYNESLYSLNLTNITTCIGCEPENNITFERTNSSFETNPLNAPVIYSAGLGEVAKVFVKASSEGRMDTGVQLLAGAKVEMTLPDIPEVKEEFPQLVEEVKYIEPEYVCGNGVRTLDEECDDGNKENNDGCSEDCQLESGRVCYSNLVGHKSKCRDVDECANTTIELRYSISDGFLKEVEVPQVQFCLNDARCVNLVGDYKCHCTDGFEGKNCSVDIDECATNTHNCAQDATCTNEYGSHSCDCKPGFEGDGTICENINECELEYPPIDGDNRACVYGTCTDELLGFKCDCPQNRFGDRCGAKVDFCSKSDKPNCVHGVCKNTVGGAVCVCTPGSGFEGALCDTDIDDCARLNPCVNGATCTDSGNQPHTYSCACVDGWEGDTCSDDVDDCKPDSCAHGTCADPGDGTGKYTCSCASGWEGDSCNTDTDECGCGTVDQQCLFDNDISNDFGDCHRFWATCENTLGSHKCECKTGYDATGSDGRVCRDVDECEAEPCKNGAQCLNGPARYDCKCASGWVGTTCTVNVNECASIGYPAQVWDDFQLKDATWQSPCLENTIDLSGKPSTCKDTAGNFTCTCPEDYEGNARVGGSCVPTCVREGTCTCEGATCTCNEGYQGNGVVCEDVNECDSNTDNCHANANCTNTIGKFTCACETGYSGDGTVCTDIDECATNEITCDVNADCTNIPSGYKCTCKQGFVSTGELEGRVCDDVDECLENTDNCHEQAKCSNTEGGFQCVCASDYEGDGTECNDKGGANRSSDAIIGGVVGGIIVVVLIVVVIVVVVRTRKGREIGDSTKGDESGEIPFPDKPQQPKPVHIVPVDSQQVSRIKKTVSPSIPYSPADHHHLSTSLPSAPNPQERSEEPTTSESKQQTASPASPDNTANMDEQAASAPTDPSAYVSEPLVKKTDGVELKLGARVKVNGYQMGVIRYIGELKNTAVAGITYVGVELDKAEGAGNGSIDGHKYFECGEFHALFVTMQFVEPEETGIVTHI